MISTRILIEKKHQDISINKSLHLYTQLLCMLYFFLFELKHIKMMIMDGCLTSSDKLKEKKVI